jgi:hypothetical protein
MSPLGAYLVLAIVGLSLTGGIAKCWSISRRPETNAKCVMALAVLLASWLTLVASIVLFSLIQLPNIIYQVISKVAFGMMLAGGVLATVGLQEYSRRRGQFKQGRVQAISALVLSGFLLVFLLALVVEARWNVIGIRDPPSGARALVFRDQNLKFFAPGGRWIQVETNSLDWKATVMLQRNRPSVLFVLIASEQLRDRYSVNDLADSAIEDLRHRVKGVEVTFRSEIRLSWLAGTHYGMRLTSEAGEVAHKLYFDHRLYFTNGWSYQFITWGRKEDRVTISEDANDLFRRFEVLDLNRRPAEKTNTVEKGKP